MKPTLRPPTSLGVATLAACILLLSACSAALTPTPPAPVHVKVFARPYLSYAPLYIAQDAGYFTEQGLDVEFVALPSSAAAIPPLVQGDIDVVGGTLRISALNAIAHNAQIKIVADKGHLGSGACSAYYGFAARRTLVENGTLKSAADLKGRNIEIAGDKPSMEGYFVDKLLNTAGLSLDDVNVLTLQNPVEIIDGFNKGAIDFTVQGEPVLSQLVQSKTVALWKTVQEIVSDVQFDVLLYGPTFLNKNPDAGKRFMVAYLQAVQQYNQGKTAQNLDELVRFSKLDRQLLSNACLPAISNDGKINVQSVLDFQAWAIKRKLLDAPATDTQLWDPQFVDYARKVLDARK